MSDFSRVFNSGTLRSAFRGSSTIMAPAWMTPLRWPHLPSRPASSTLGTWVACHQNGVREHAMKPSKSLIVAAYSSSVHALRISSPTSRVSPFDRFLILAAVVRFPDWVSGLSHESVSPAASREHRSAVPRPQSPQGVSSVRPPTDRRGGPTGTAGGHGAGELAA